MTGKLWRLLAYVLWFALAGGPAAAFAAEIAIVLSNRGEAQTSFLDALREDLANTADFRLVDAGVAGEALDEAALGRAELIIAVGTEAASALAPRPSAPILAVLISSHNLAALQVRYPKARLGGIVLDQPAARHFRLIRAALPNADRVGILLGPQSAAVRATLNEAAAHEGLRVQFEQIEDGTTLLAALERLLDNNDVILAVPDAVAFTATTARPILLTTYRYRKPMFGYSQAYVTAGALAAVFSAPQDVARQVADWLRRAAGRFDPPTGDAPRQFSVAVNRHVARALGYALADERQLASTIEKRRQP